MNILDQFLKYEILESEELREEVLLFINSYEIRSGEFEGNEYILKKIDRKTFLIYAEYELPNGEKDYSSNAEIININNLLNKIEEVISIS